MPMDHEAPSVEFLERILGRHEELGPRPERVTEEYADERIREKIARYPDEKQQAGIWSVNRSLKERDVPPALRLHLVQAVVQLSRIAEDSLAERLERARER